MTNTNVDSSPLKEAAPPDKALAITTAFKKQIDESLSEVQEAIKTLRTQLDKAYRLEARLEGQKQYAEAFEKQYNK